MKSGPTFYISRLYCIPIFLFATMFIYNDQQTVRNPIGLVFDQGGSIYFAGHLYITNE